MNVAEKIELFFFDPAKPQEEYEDYYKKVNPKRFKKENKKVRLSPMYLLLRDIRFCFGFGRQFKPIREDLEPPEFAGIVLLRIAFTNTVKKIYFGNFQKFAEKYLDIEDKELLEGLNLLRNALEHSYYSLYTYKENSEGKDVKVYFSLGFYDWVIKKDANWSRPYPSKMYRVNPRKLFTSFSRGMRQLKEDLMDDENVKLRENFLKNFGLDEWVVI